MHEVLSELRGTSECPRVCASGERRGRTEVYWNPGNTLYPRGKELGYVGRFHGRFEGYGKAFTRWGRDNELREAPGDGDKLYGFFEHRRR